MNECRGRSFYDSALMSPVDGRALGKVYDRALMSALSIFWAVCGSAVGGGCPNLNRLHNGGHCNISKLESCLVHERETRLIA